MTRFDQILSCIQEEKLVTLCGDLVRFKTVNPPGDERPCAEYIASFLETAGFTTELVHHAENRSSLIARLKGSGEKPGLMLSGHLDVVPVGAEPWLHPPFDGEVVDGVLWGRGTSDMKGGVASILAAAEAVAAGNLPLKGDLILAFTAGEEGEQLGAGVIAKRTDLAPVQAVIITEPSYNDLYIAEKGAFWLKITTHGKTAHGATPQYGRNAIMMMAPFLQALEGQKVPFEVHPLLGGFTRSINTIKGGVLTNVVPDYCEVTIDQRTVPGQDHDAILKGVEDLIAEFSQQHEGFSAKVTVINNAIPVASPADDPVIQRFSDFVDEITGVRPEPKGVAYYTDAVNLVPAMNAPLIICGPGKASLAHQPNEHVEVAKMVECAKIVALSAGELLT
ncbi:MAG: M20 family peptidase [Chloroflexi bacterium]|nr:MAG: M20 family peptidase [Chloroflexota bacterium]